MPERCSPPPRCRSRSSAENSLRTELPGTVRRRIPAVHPESVTTDRRRFRIPRPQAVPLLPLRPDDILSPATTAACPPSSVRECRPRFPRTGKDPHASAKPTPSVLSHEFPVFTPMLRRPICLPPSGNAARPLRNRKPNPIPDPSPASPDAPAPISPPIPPDTPIRCRPRRPELPENGLRKIQTVLFIN